ncbi:MAG TPA: Gfo/Idh/MocA family oxidoreductase [Cyclobacteriaceae bacterium]|nr:Gfo/Idh/MocA family oxidoreductase [Cyclobacteriaceae bacterium]
MNPIKFGILGPGKIANRFADAFQYVPDAKVYSIASRDAAKAKEFAAKTGAQKWYGTYEALAEDPDADVIYIATPHPYHYEQTLMCLNHGKAVLCEKPMSLNLRQTTEMIELAKRKKIFLMEAMWSRFFATTHKTIELIKAGKIGDVKFVHADFGFAGPVNMESRLYSLALGGGAQLDVGVYPLFFALLLLGNPNEIKALSHLASTGADTITNALLSFRSGAVAHIHSSIVSDSVKEAHVIGTLGKIIIESPWHKSQKVTLKLNSGETQEFSFPHSGNGFEFQIEEVVRCLRAGKTESDLMPFSLSLLMAEVSDEIRRQGGVKYAVD